MRTSFQPGEIYHVYNQGNNRLQLYWTDRHYEYFVKKIHSQICPFAEVLAYCLMPNHYHLMLIPKETNQQIHPLHRKLGTLQSSYTQGVNRDLKRTGSLFRQNLKIKHLYNSEYLNSCFHYIHRNPLTANLVTKIEEWKYSSFGDYLSNSSSFIKIDLAYEKIPELEPHSFYLDSYNRECKLEP